MDWLSAYRAQLEAVAKGYQTLSQIYGLLLQTHDSHLSDAERGQLFDATDDIHFNAENLTEMGMRLVEPKFALVSQNDSVIVLQDGQEMLRGIVRSVEDFGRIFNLEVADVSTAVTGLFTAKRLPNGQIESRTLIYRSPNGWAFREDPNPLYNLQLVINGPNYTVYTFTQPTQPQLQPQRNTIQVGDIALVDTRLRDEITRELYPPKEAPITAIRKGGREIDVKLYGETTTYTYRPGAQSWAIKGKRSHYLTNVYIKFRTPEGQEIAWPPTTED